VTRITLVKKSNSDGNQCRKCDDVSQRLQRDADSDGMVLAARYGVERAPFFIVKQPDKEPQVYTVYMQLLRDVLKEEDGGDEREHAMDLADKGTVDFL